MTSPAIRSKNVPSISYVMPPETPLDVALVQVFARTEPMSHHSILARLTASALALLLIFPASLATAGPEEAREYFKQAKQAYTNGEYEKAASLLEKAYSEEANLTYQYNRIRALEGAGQHAKALEVLKTYEQPMLDAKGFEDVPKLKKSLQKKVSAEKGEGETEEEAPEMKETKRTESTATTTSGGKGMKILGWTLAGLGVASGGTGIVFGTGALLPKNFSEEQQQQQITMTIVFGSVGLGALIGGGVILLQELGGGHAESEMARSAPRNNVRLAPFFSGDGAGANLQVRFR